MRKPATVFLLLAACDALLCGQRIAVFSEFQRPRPDGEVFSADRAAARREILSPALIRNGHASFLFTVEAPPGEGFTIYVAQNPDGAVKADVYQLDYVSVGGEWAPDGLKPAPLPVQAVLAEGRKTQAYLLDLVLPASAPVERFRLEIQLHAAGRWTIYPMEMRPMETTAPGAPPLRGRLAPVASRADETVSGALRGVLCDGGAVGAVELNTLRAVILRNALQDFFIARQREQQGGGRLLDRLFLPGGWTSREEFCRSAAPAPRGAEWWLRVRGLLYQGLRLPELSLSP